MVNESVGKEPETIKVEADDDLDNLLDDALGDFSKKAKSPEASPVNNAEPEQEISFEEEFARQLNLEMQGLLGPTEGEDLKASFEKMLSGDAGSSDHSKSFQSTINNTMNKLKNSSDQVKAEVKEDTPEALMEQLMRQMEGLSDSPDFEKAIEGMMGQIMTKDLLYEPMKDLTDKYPEWLALNKEKISADDYALYSQQQKIVSEVVESFEKQSTDDKGEVIECEENSKLQKRVMQLMQEMQELGQPPADLLKMISPDLEVGEDGQPKMPKELEECTIM
ncbi:Peroxisome chaperone and import receptor [Entomophthora muscae]|uniref:Peroxisome chaperone and import receptor n=2 Tax=Entomophthora muscae TaxID=34485 RepID=A0ACC2TYN3_9FUNG|nr:Peroxisome chaperone and import receptor [Entomophthora muscae]